MSGKLVRRVVDLANLPPLTSEQMAEIERLAAMPESEIDTSDIPELTDGIGAAIEADYGDLDAALNRLEAEAPELSRIVELRFFGGLSVEECAGFLAISTATVNRHWRLARAWLHRELNPTGE